MLTSLDISPVNEWFALQTKMRYERFVGAVLNQKGFETFVPIFSASVSYPSRSDARLDRVLFPGYVFARFDVTHRLSVLTTPGVYTVVGCGKTPVAIPEAEIAAIQRAVSSRMSIEPCSYLNVGSRVRVLSGPLANYEGILTDNRSGRRVVISISAIQRSVRVQVDRDNVLLLDVEKSYMPESDLKTA